MSYREAVSEIKSSKVSKKNKDQMLQEVANSVKEPFDNDFTLDHAQILENFANCVVEQELIENTHHKRQTGFEGQKAKIKQEYIEKHKADGHSEIQRPPKGKPKQNKGVDPLGVSLCIWLLRR